MISIWTVSSGGTGLGVQLNVDDLAKLFGSQRFAVNINWMAIHLASFEADDISLFADLPVEIDESSGDKTTFSDANMFPHMVSVIRSTGGIDQVARSGYKALFRFSSTDITEKTKSFSAWPITKSLTMTWSADVDFVLTMDYTILATQWNMRNLVMDLLANKTQVEDPNLSNVDGKRAIRRAALPSTF